MANTQALPVEISKVLRNPKVEGFSMTFTSKGSTIDRGGIEKRARYANDEYDFIVSCLFKVTDSDILRLKEYFDNDLANTTLPFGWGFRITSNIAFGKTRIIGDFTIRHIKSKNTKIMQLTFETRASIFDISRKVSTSKVQILPKELREFFKPQRIGLTLGSNNSNNVRFVTEEGEDRVEARGTSYYQGNMVMNVIMKKDKLEKFLQFYATTLNFGVNPFIWDLQYTPDIAIANATFSESHPTITHVNGEWFNVTMTIKIREERLTELPDSISDLLDDIPIETFLQILALLREVNALESTYISNSVFRS